MRQALRVLLTAVLVALGLAAAVVITALTVNDLMDPAREDCVACD